MKRKAPGILPIQRWLIEHGYTGLVQAMRKHPEAFAHIKQDSKRGKSIREWVTIAERLEKKHGTLPNPKWLYDNGYGSLAAMMVRHPVAFAHIEQVKLKHGDGYWIGMAEKLARQHDGLPTSGWLQANGLSNLDQKRRAKPHLYAHIKQKWEGGKLLEEWVKVAEKLVYKYGLIPKRTKLRQMGYGTLIQYLTKHRDIFSRFPRDMEDRKSPSQWCRIAEKLKKKYGILPTTTWLNSHNYTGLTRAMCKCPKLFLHVKRKDHLENENENLELPQEETSPA